MGKYISQRAIKRKIRESLPDKNMRIGADALDCLTNYFESEIEKVISEAVKTEYSTIKGVDIRRGINKERKVILKQVLDALEWSMTQFHRMKTQLEKEITE